MKQVWIFILPLLKSCHLHSYSFRRMQIKFCHVSFAYRLIQLNLSMQISVEQNLWSGKRFSPGWKNQINSWLSVELNFDQSPHDLFVTGSIDAMRYGERILLSEYAMNYWVKTNEWTVCTAIGGVFVRIGFQCVWLLNYAYDLLTYVNSYGEKGKGCFWIDCGTFRVNSLSLWPRSNYWNAGSAIFRIE